MRQNYHKRKAFAALGTFRTWRDSTLKQSHGRAAEARTFLLLVLSRASMAQQSTAKETLYRASSRLEKFCCFKGNYSIKHEANVKDFPIPGRNLQSHTPTSAQLR